ncbi:SLOG family protein [Dyella sp. ASV21]|uniref:SLOG family protein n=1 Tax=Dyella sp. ASV21 TaxID=2795114 RepID=UPI0018EC27B4|nr:SLOG family protein [Dyella sp. ASV21]
MKIIVAGGRDFANIELMHDHITHLVQHGWMADDSTLVCGMARGADMLAYTLWTERYDNPVEKFPADWDRLGKGAGFIRNRQMAETADKLIAFWDGKSRGTEHMVQTMQTLGKPVHIVRYQV